MSIFNNHSFCIWTLVEQKYLEDYLHSTDYKSVVEIIGYTSWIFIYYGLARVVDVLAEAAADNLIEDLVNNEDNESSHKDNPATGEKDTMNRRRSQNESE